MASSTALALYSSQVLAAVLSATAWAIGARHSHRAPVSKCWQLRHEWSAAPQFLQVLPAKKVAQLYQIENKLRAMVDYDLTQSVPLIK